MASSRRGYRSQSPDPRPFISLKEFRRPLAVLVVVDWIAERAGLTTWYLGLDAHFLELAKDRSEKRLRDEFRSVPFVPH